MNTLHGIQSIDQSQGGLAVAVAELCSHLEGASILEGTQAENPVPVSSPQLQSADVADYDLVHQHGLWTSAMRSLAGNTRRAGKPFVISPHGMLEPWALNHRRFKKKLGRLLFQDRILKQAAAIHATSEMEAEHIRDLGFTQPICILPNGVSSGWRDEFRELSGKKKAVFLSRLDRKKGIPMLLRAWSSVGAEDWELQIFGNGSDGEISEIHQMISNLGFDDSVSFQGPVFDEEKWRALGRADLFVLPSHSENFGVVVAEAMQAGVPVITTTATPWKLITEEGIGWWVDPDVESIQGALKTAVSLSRAELEAKGKTGQSIVKREFEWGRIANRMTRFYEWILNRGEQPDFVID